MLLLYRFHITSLYFYRSSDYILANKALPISELLIPTILDSICLNSLSLVDALLSY
nr:MAG TPA: hypothetical protein [Caudoviricetes sp.]